MTVLSCLLLDLPSLLVSNMSLSTCQSFLLVCVWPSHLHSYYRFYFFQKESRNWKMTSSSLSSSQLKPSQSTSSCYTQAGTSVRMLTCGHTNPHRRGGWSKLSFISAPHCVLRTDLHHCRDVHPTTKLYITVQLFLSNASLTLFFSFLPFSLFQFAQKLHMGLTAKINIYLFTFSY